MGDVSEHFSKIEFTCRCGCNEYIEPTKLIGILENFRQFCCDETGKEVRFVGHCGLRCPIHNSKFGGDSSRHLPKFYKLNRGAFDFHSPDITNIKLRALARKARKKGILTGGVGYYLWGLHIDSDTLFPRRWGLWI